MAGVEHDQRFRKIPLRVRRARRNGGGGVAPRLLLAFGAGARGGVEGRCFRRLDDERQFAAVLLRRAGGGKLRGTRQVDDDARLSRRQPAETVGQFVGRGGVCGGLGGAAAFSLGARGIAMAGIDQELDFGQVEHGARRLVEHIGLMGDAGVEAEDEPGLATARAVRAFDAHVVGGRRLRPRRTRRDQRDNGERGAPQAGLPGNGRDLLHARLGRWRSFRRFVWKRINLKSDHEIVNNI